MTKRTKIVFTIVAILVVIAAGATAFFGLDVADKIRDRQKEKEKQEIIESFLNTGATPPVSVKPGNVVTNALPESTPAPVNAPSTPPSEEEEVVIKDKVLLNVQFIPQGPLDPGPAHWALHKESCEEAAILMAHDYLLGRTVTMQQANEEIFELVDWQKDNFGDEHDIYADEVKQVLEGFYDHSDVRIIKDASIDDLKKQLSAGRPVIVPSIAKYLHNPRYYDQDYHMFVVVGYTQDRIIANDNGTTWGEDYPYPYDDFMEAVTAAGGDVVVIHE